MAGLAGQFRTSDQRAWIATDAVTAEPPTFRVGDEAFINISFKNSGKTPAKDLLVTLAVETVQKGKPPAFSNAGKDVARFGLLPPNATASMRVSANPSKE